MKSITKLILMILILLTCSFTCKQQGNEWKGSIEYENGIKVIKNTKESLYGEIVFELEEDLTVGGEDDENYMFYRPMAIEVDEDENIFVLDFGNHRIQKFDKNGNYVQTIGRKGQGPGEFERPWGIYLDHEDKIYVKDRRMIHIFDKKGEFVRSMKLNNSISTFGIAENGNILIHTTAHTLDELTTDIILISPDGKKLKTIASFPAQLSPLIKGKIRLSNPYSPWLYFCPLNEKFGIYGYSSEYKIFIINSSGEIVYIIEKNVPLEPITKKDKDKLIDRTMEAQKRRERGSILSRGEIKSGFKFPKYKPFYDRIVKDDKERIYVRRFKLTSENEKMESYDLFNKEGYYIYEVKISLRPIIIKKGHIYKLSRDQDTDDLRVKRYKIKNWSEIKEGSLTF